MKNTKKIVKTNRLAEKEFKSILADTVTKLCGIISNAKTAGAAIFKDLVLSYCKAHSVDWAQCLEVWNAEVRNVETKESGYLNREDNKANKIALDTLKEVKKILRPLLCKKADISVPTFNAYASGWTSNLDWPKQYQNPKEDEDTDIPADADTIDTQDNDGSSVSLSECSIHTSGDVEKDCDKLELELTSLIQDPAYGATVCHLLKELVERVETGKIKVAIKKIA